MKVQVIDLEVLAEDIRKWGVLATIHYDEYEEAYVLHAGEIDYGREKGKAEVTIAPGFKYKHSDGTERIFAYVNNLHLAVTEDEKVNSAMRSRIISESRMEHHRSYKKELIIR